VPEGDTIHRTARNLALALAGRRVVRFETPRRRGISPPPGAVVDAVEAQGKHLLVRFDDGLVLHTHLQMRGSWHLYRAGQSWRRPVRQARVVLEVGGGTVAVCFNAPVVEVLAAGAPGAAGLGALGPDLAASDPDLADVQRRLDRLDAATEIGVALLDQRVAAGIGNVYKCEVCFECGIDPFAPLASLDRDTREALYGSAARQLRANLTTPRRVTVRGAPPGTLAVYGRSGRPCRRCGTPIRARRQGDQGPGRVTYWCPRCQPPLRSRAPRPIRR
jgi:endonuclease VIII